MARNISCDSPEFQQKYCPQTDAWCRNDTCKGCSFKDDNVSATLERIRRANEEVIKRVGGR